MRNILASKSLLVRFSFLFKFAEYGRRQQTILYGRGCLSDPGRERFAGQVLVRQVLIVHQAGKKQERQQVFHPERHWHFLDDTPSGERVRDDSGRGQGTPEAESFRG